MKFKYDSELYDLTDGRVIASFVDCTPFTPTPKMRAQYPNSGPTVKWEFEIVSGPDAGKPCSSVTTRIPTPKNACMRMISGLIRRTLSDKEDIDTDSCRGLYYAISIVGGYVSNKFPPQYLGRDLTTALRTFNPDEILPEPEKGGTESLPF